MRPPPVSVVLPTYNRATLLPGAVCSIQSQSLADWELIVVDDGSTDHTVRLLPILTDRHGRLRILRHSERRGVGASLRTALTTARHPLLFYTLCDPRYRPVDLNRLLKEIDRVHLVTGYRAGEPVPRFWRWIGAMRRGLGRLVLGHSDPPLPGWLGWKHHLGGLVVRLLFGVRNQDVTCPFRLARRSIFARIPLQSDGGFVHVEILAKATFLGLLLGEEVPLGDRNHPVTAADTKCDSVGRPLADAARVFRHPDFGPAKVAVSSAAN